MPWIDIRETTPTYEELAADYGLLIQDRDDLEEQFSDTTLLVINKKIMIDEEVDKKEIFRSRIQIAKTKLLEAHQNGNLTLATLRQALVYIYNNYLNTEEG